MQKVCVVTGSNKGIGYATVKKLCKEFDGVVYLTSRDERRGKEAIESLKKDGLSPAFHQLNIDDVASIEKLAAHIKEKYGGLDVLVNNAGIAYKGNSTAPFGEQAEVTVGTNYFSTSNAFKIMFPLLRPHARVVNVSSLAGVLSGLKGKELKEKFVSPTLTEEGLNAMMQEFITLAKSGKHLDAGWTSSAYRASKIGLCALTRIQQRQMDADPRPDLVVNSCCPGYVDTDMSSHNGSLTPDEGATNPCYLALLPPNISEPKGAFFSYPKKFVEWTQS